MNGTIYTKTLKDRVVEVESTNVEHYMQKQTLNIDALTSTQLYCEVCRLIMWGIDFLMPTFIFQHLTNTALNVVDILHIQNVKTKI